MAIKAIRLVLVFTLAHLYIDNLCVPAFEEIFLVCLDVCPSTTSPAQGVIILKRILDRRPTTTEIKSNLTTDGKHHLQHTPGSSQHYVDGNITRAQ